MLEKPNIPDGLIVSRIQAEYDLCVVEFTFLPLGADSNSAVYRVTTDDGAAYFLKLRKGFNEITVTVPLFLKAQGVQNIIVPFETKSKQRWADFGEYKLILYPFVVGKDGFEVDFSDSHWHILGAAFKGIHSAQVPPELSRLIPHETYSPFWRESVKSFQVQVERRTFDDPIAARLAKLMQSKRDEINRIIRRAEELASELQSRPLEFVICHSDSHGGNILISDTDELYVVDWDGPILASKERDLMFIGGGFIGRGMDDLERRSQEEALFYAGYGKADVNLPALAYYRYERIINDFAAYCEALLLTDDGGADREPGFQAFASNFQPGNMIENADETYALLTHKR